MHHTSTIKSFFIDKIINFIKIWDEIRIEIEIVIILRLRLGSDFFPGFNPNHNFNSYHNFIYNFNTTFYIFNIIFSISIQLFSIITQLFTFSKYFKPNQQINHTPNNSPYGAYMYNLKPFKLYL